MKFILVKNLEVKNVHLWVEM